MMQLEVKCRICGKLVLVECDEDYAAANDPYKLVGMLTCDRCYDLRDRRLRLDAGLSRISALLRVIRGAEREKERQELIGKARIILQAYLRLLCEQERIGGVIEWDEGIVDRFAYRPQDVAGILGLMLKTVRQVAKEEQLDLGGDSK